LCNIVAMVDVSACQTVAIHGDVLIDVKGLTLDDRFVESLTNLEANCLFLIDSYVPN
jgi:hypothetical protein